ncbi:MAG: DUF4968 domain-containing protein [Anaerolineae bacterium]
MPKGFIRLTPYSDSIVRVRYALNPAFSTKESLIIQREPDEKVNIKVSESPDDVIFSTPNLSIQINKRTGAFKYLDSSNGI